MSDETRDASTEAPRIPDALPVLPLRDTVVFPNLPAPLVVGRPLSIRTVDQVLLGNKTIALVAQKNPSVEEPAPDDLFNVGTAATVLKLLKYPDGTLRVLTRGMERIRLLDVIQREPITIARVEALREVPHPGPDVDGLTKNLLNQIQKMIAMLPINADELGITFLNVDNPGRLADMAAAVFGLKLDQKQEILETLDVKARLEKITRFISREIEVMEIGSKIQQEVQEEIDKNQRKFYLREQMKAIQKELGDEDESAAEINELTEKIRAAGMPPEVEKEATKELNRLRLTPAASAEHSVIRNYLDILIDLPWARSTEDKLDIAEARRVLDDDHYDLEKVKDRILEYLAVLKLKQDLKGPILCFVGPPGTGKTSLGRSIARAMGRNFHRVSLGGVRDEAEIRGHRRTYIGSMPGRIVQSIRKVGSNNPVIVLDEVDKVGADFRGDPSAALLEVLDPEQNFSFSDHYLEVPFDLSRVLFITTANVLDTIPPALRDRMEVLQLPGYTEEEKLHIARRHLIPRQLANHGLSQGTLLFEDAAVARIISGYTREAGLRNLERELGSVCRKVARRVAEGATGPITVQAQDVEGYLGPEKFFSETAERTRVPGVAIGLAWTPAGGEILYIESTHMKGSKGLTLTGQLGEVMKESAQAALSYVRSRALALGIAPDFFESSDVHIHIPAGAIPKDGPSAGVTIVASLVSLLTGVPCCHDVAMTGEITLRGKVLPVGGIKEKVLAARRAGIYSVILPARNRKDLADVPEELRRDVTFHFVETLDEALAIALKAPVGAVSPSKEA
ncbi:MAG TPA: endopeptidase La [Candidatus Polarisedimenticolia bacterium]|nr:endopeptidase La [Candidatus Polarisedimenticolia bacterium]